MKNKQDIITEIQATSTFSKATIETVVQDFVEVLKEELINGNEVYIRELGKFKVSTRKARKARNPATGEIVELPERQVVRLKISSAINIGLNSKLNDK